MQFLSAEAVADNLPWHPLIDRIGQAFRDGVEAPPRHHHAIHRPDGEATMLLMPAWEKDGYIGMKMVNVFPQNADKGLPAISGLYMLCDGSNGQPLACIDGSELTRRRTAAASALASQQLAREDAGRLLVIGTGRLAPMLIEAHAAVRPIRHLQVWGRNADKAHELAKQYEGYEGGLAAFESSTGVTDLAAGVPDADIISCATLSQEAIVLGHWLSEGAHLDLVGAFRRTMRETDATCIERGEIFVDTYAGAEGEAGDLHHAADEGTFSFDHIKADLAELLRGVKKGRSSNAAITVFKSVGASLEDLAAAIEVWERQ
ncbi:ornithine cyclodeaminase family protein [Marinobacter fonticola]|uniref:ornithine cyclodeaminase family protein n=1 Tax=Marinobacter fonticola TaxID=2603215 RepID=UPI0011E6E011|nr:ornithine cyclodeaminase family protein [Marinobacter fonticola]